MLEFLEFCKKVFCSSCPSHLTPQVCPLTGCRLHSFFEWLKSQNLVRLKESFQLCRNGVLIKFRSLRGKKNMFLVKGKKNESKL